MNAGWIPPCRQTSVAPRSQASSRAPHDLVERHEVRRAAQVRGELPLRERAEAAAEVADVRVLDVPRDDVRHLVAADLAAERVRRRAHARGLLPARLEKARDLVLAELGSDRARAAARHAGRRTARRPARPAPRSRRARARSRRRRGARTARQPDRPSARARRRTPDRAEAAARARARASASPRRGARSPATAPPGSRGRSSPARRRPSRRCPRRAGAGSRRTRGSAEPARATSGPSRMRATAIVQRWSSSDGSGWEAMRVPGFARKFWTMTSCTCPCSSPSAFSASSASIRSSRVSPIPMRIPLVNGIESSPASRIVSRRRAGTLSGDAQCGPPFAPSRSAVVSSMIPIDAETGRSASSSARVITPGLRCGSRPGLLEHESRTALEVLERRRAAERAQLLARDLVAQLRLVAEREERLAAAGGGARARDREHLLLRHERALAAPRRTRERAVAADVAAERRQRDEDLRRVRDERAAAQAASLGEQLLERRGRAARSRGYRLTPVPPHVEPGDRDDVTSSALRAIS